MSTPPGSVLLSHIKMMYPGILHDFDENLHGNIHVRYFGDLSHDELEPVRAREVRVQMVIDPALRLEFAALSTTDAAWRASAASAAFSRVSS